MRLQVPGQQALHLRDAGAGLQVQVVGGLPGEHHVQVCVNQTGKEQVAASVCARVDGWMDGWVDRWMDG